MKKKIGVSPLIAGIFLIILAIILGTILAQQVNQTPTKQNVKSKVEDACGPAIDYYLKEKENHSLACYSYEENTTTAGIQMTLKNNGNPIAGFQVRIITDSWIFEDEIKEPLAMHDQKTYSYYYDFNKGYAGQIRVWPIINKNGQEVVCVDHPLTLSPSDLDSCPLFS